MKTPSLYRQDSSESVLVLSDSRPTLSIGIPADGSYSATVTPKGKKPLSMQDSSELKVPFNLPLNDAESMSSSEVFPVKMLVEGNDDSDGDLKSSLSGQSAVQNSQEGSIINEIKIAENYAAERREASG